MTQSYKNNEQSPLTRGLGGFIKIILSGGFLLMASAIITKVLGFFRDRILLQNFGAEQVDLIFAALRITDFFFYLLIASSVSVLFIPKYQALKKEEKTKPQTKFKPPLPMGEAGRTSSNNLASSFFFLIFLGFGSISLLGLFSGNFLTNIFIPGFSDLQQSQVIEISKFLWGNIFLLALSSLFTAYLQAKQKFAWMAVSPLIYSISIVLGVFSIKALNIVFIGTDETVTTQNYLEIFSFIVFFSAFLHLLISFSGFLYYRGRINFLFPRTRGLGGFKDYLSRVLTGSAYQINQAVDVIIVSFLLAGSLTAFTLGTNLGHILLSIVGIPIAQWLYPRMSKTSEKSQKIFYLKRGLRIIFLLTIPAVIFAIFFGKFLLAKLFHLSDFILDQTFIVFLMTVLTLPFACSIPILSRYFLSNQDTSTPLIITITALIIATSTAAILCLIILPEKTAIWGLAIGNALANSISFFGFIGMIFLQKK